MTASHRSFLYCARCEGRCGECASRAEVQGTGQAQREEKMKAVDRSAVQEDEEEEESGCGSIYNVDSSLSSLSPSFPLS